MRETVAKLKRTYPGVRGRVSELCKPKQKKYEEAEKWLNKAIEAEPNDPEAHVILAETFIKRQPPQPDKAIQELQRATKIDAKSAHAYGIWSKPMR